VEAQLRRARNGGIVVEPNIFEVADIAGQAGIIAAKGRLE
jgi:hypothetical protein